MCEGHDHGAVQPGPFVSVEGPAHVTVRDRAVGPFGPRPRRLMTTYCVGDFTFEPLVVYQLLMERWL